MKKILFFLLLASPINAYSVLVNTDLKYYPPTLDSNRVPDIKLHTKDEIRVMIIDSGVGSNKLINDYVKDWEVKSDVNNRFDEIGHGTHVTGIIVNGNLSDKNRGPKVCSNVKIYSCKYTSKSYPFDSDIAVIDRVKRCFEKAIDLKIDVINFSGGGVEPSLSEYRWVKKAIKSGSILISAAGNESVDLDENPRYFPAMYAKTVKFTEYYNKTKKTKIFTLPGIPDVYVVSALIKPGLPSSISNHSRISVWDLGYKIKSTMPNNEFETMSGTSMAAPMFLRRILLKKCNNMVK